ncbi:5-hydroxytryptamine receptor 2A-like [Paramacrobiotus metropolitanus]|uniref:5-hydroxytryptamine receptor 2A-like n=1 Tax=Paramacrobiotus metropolitanus TaxID=2943436 RepID=UPI0024459F7D|nr:5-hydroxytryptamine receptor 2A-like [Paramacrobiotus metropolitanus]
MTIAANFLVICAFFADRQARTAFNYYLFNLAVADFLTGTMGMTSYAVFTYYNCWPWSYALCTVWMYFDFLSTSVMMLTLQTISVDRLWAVTFPVSYKRHHTCMKSQLAVLGIWVFSNGLIVPSLTYYRVYFGINEDPREYYWDAWLQPSYASCFYQLIFLYWTPALMTIVAYCGTTWQIWRRRGARRISATGTLPTWREVQQAKKEHQGYVLLSLLMAALIVMFGPYFAYEALSMRTGYYNYDFFTVTYWMGYSLSAVNPFLFNWGSPEMHNAVSKLMGCRRRRESRGVQPSVPVDERAGNSASTGVNPRR